MHNCIFKTEIQTPMTPNGLGRMSEEMDEEMVENDKASTTEIFDKVMIVDSGKEIKELTPLEVMVVTHLKKMTRTGKVMTDVTRRNRWEVASRRGRVLNAMSARVGDTCVTSVPIEFC